MPKKYLLTLKHVVARQKLTRRPIPFMQKHKYSLTALSTCREISAGEKSGLGVSSQVLPNPLVGWERGNPQFATPGVGANRNAVERPAVGEPTL